jgi:predicted flap endonuclease-1-like 5' DNA nuclease
MGHYVLELAIFILLAYILGCFVGVLVRRTLGRTASALVPDTPAAASTAPALASELPEPAEPPAGGADDLQRIRGIGSRNESILHRLGVFRFDQIAAWGPADISRIEERLRFSGRIGREAWVDQARLLAEGRIEEFEQRYGTGKSSPRKSA